MRKTIISILACVLAGNAFAQCTGSLRPNGSIELIETIPATPTGACFGWDATLTRSLQYGEYPYIGWSKTGNQPHGVQLEPGKTFANPITSAREDKPSNVVTKPVPN